MVLAALQIVAEEQIEYLRGRLRVLGHDLDETARVFDLLLGDNLAGRKDYIAENGYKYLDMIDVS